MYSSRISYTVRATMTLWLRLFQIVAAINDAGVEEDGGFLTCFGGWSSTTP